MIPPQEQAQPRPSKGRAARVRVADLEDAAPIAQLLSETRPEPLSSEEVTGDLEQGGALLLEDDTGTLLCALTWLEADRGWTLRQPAVRGSYTGQALDRWVLTKLEALAIQRNVPALEMHLHDEALLPLYRRMGYRQGSDLHLSKRVGGTWQTQGDA